MIINKELKPYGYTAEIRFDNQKPKLYVVEAGAKITLSGPMDLHVISGTATTKRIDINGKASYDTYTTFDTGFIPERIKLELRVSVDSRLVLLAHQHDKITAADMALNDLQKLPEVIEDEPSSDDLEYIEE